MFPYRPLWIAHTVSLWGTVIHWHCSHFSLKNGTLSWNKTLQKPHKQQGRNRSTWQHACSYLQGSAAFSTAAWLRAGEPAGRVY